MVVISHPTGNQNVRQAVRALEHSGLLQRFHTTVYWDSQWKINSLLPASFVSELGRRGYPDAPKNKIHLTPFREAARLFSHRLGLSKLKAVSLMSVYNSLDRVTAATVRNHKPRAVYAYEGAALRSFEEAKRRGVKCIYELPSGYWYYEIDLLREEAELKPEYAATIINKLQESRENLEAKDRELQLADFVIVPSRHVVRTLQRMPLGEGKLHVVPYGANQSDAPVRSLGAPRNRRLRVLFVGGLVQRKGISYLLDAVRQMGGSIEFTMIGSRRGESAPLDQALRTYRWLPSLPHPKVLEEMAAHDVLVLPSLSEGFALVISEALSRGLPVITTLNSGGEEIIRDWVEGFFVPIRSSEAIVEKLELLDRRRDLLDSMSSSAVQRARECSWQHYRSLLVSTLQRIVPELQSCSTK
jgi:alpha-maltose-1-phosphate synthase